RRTSTACGRWPSSRPTTSCGGPTIRTGTGPGRSPGRPSRSSSGTSPRRSPGRCSGRTFGASTASTTRPDGREADGRGNARLRASRGWGPAARGALSQDVSPGSGGVPVDPLDPKAPPRRGLVDRERPPPLGSRPRRGQPPTIDDDLGAPLETPLQVAANLPVVPAEDDQPRLAPQLVGPDSELFGSPETAPGTVDQLERLELGEPTAA